MRISIDHVCSTPRSACSLRACSLDVATHPKSLAWISTDRRSNYARLRRRRSVSSFVSYTHSHSLPATGTLFYVSHKERNPGPQLPFDPEKKTLVVLGSGWGATSLLKHLDTQNYNTVRIRILSYPSFSHSALRSLSVQRTFSSSPLSSHPSQWVHSALVLSYSVRLVPFTSIPTHISYSHSLSHSSQG